MIKSSYFLFLTSIILFFSFFLFKTLGISSIQQPVIGIDVSEPDESNESDYLEGKKAYDDSSSDLDQSNCDSSNNQSSDDSGESSEPMSESLEESMHIHVDESSEEIFTDFTDDSSQTSYWIEGDGGDNSVDAKGWD